MFETLGSTSISGAGPFIQVQKLNIKTTFKKKVNWYKLHALKLRCVRLHYADIYRVANIITIQFSGSAKWIKDTKKND